MPGAFSAASSNSGIPNLADSPSLAAVKTAIVSTPAGVTGIGQTAGMKHQRTVLAPLAGGGSMAATLTWTAPFADANYTPVANVVDATGFATAGLILERIISWDQNSVTCRVRNSSGGSITGSLNVIAMHD